MNRRRDDWISRERLLGQAVPTPRPELTIRHCWVTDAHGRQPGLLLEWRKVAAGWQGRVVRPALEAGGWMVVEEWLPASVLSSAR